MSAQPKTPITEAIKKLPQWLQEHIAGLHRTIESLTEENVQLRGKAEYQDTNTFLRNFRGPHLPLPKNAVIRFQYGPEFNEYIDIGFDRPGLDRLDETGKALIVRGGETELSVIPDCRNGLHIRGA